MIKYLIHKIGTKTEFEGNIVIQPPNSKLAKSIFNYLINLNFIIQNRKKNIQPIYSHDFEHMFQFVKDNFEKKNHAFIIDISKKAAVDLQIIHPIIATENNLEEEIIEFGFMVSINFDNEITKLEKFKHIEYYSEFTRKIWKENIESYTLNCGTDTKKLSEVSKKVLETIYDYPYYTKFFVTIHNQGVIKNNSA